MREYIDRKGENLEASYFSQETIILEDMTKLFKITFLHREESFNLTFSQLQIVSMIELTFFQLQIVFMIKLDGSMLFSLFKMSFYY